MSARQLAARFGPLEIDVLSALWKRGSSAAVRDLMPEFPGTAYTTLMTTMDRLFHKGILLRQKVGRAFVYEPRFSQDEQVLDIAASAFNDVLPDSGDGATAILARFVDVVAARDEGLLDNLESLVRDRRQALRDKARGHS